MADATLRGVKGVIGWVSEGSTSFGRREVFLIEVMGGWGYPGEGEDAEADEPASSPEVDLPLGE